MPGYKQRAENLCDQQVYNQLLIRCISFRKTHLAAWVLFWEDRTGEQEKELAVLEEQRQSEFWGKSPPSSIPDMQARPISISSSRMGFLTFPFSISEFFTVCQRQTPLRGVCDQGPSTGLPNANSVGTRSSPRSRSRHQQTHFGYNWSSFKESSPAPGTCDKVESSQLHAKQPLKKKSGLHK